MAYYHTPTNTARNPGVLETKLSDGKQLGVEGNRWTGELAALCGFVVIVEPAPPTPSASEVVESSVGLVAGVPTRTHTLRAKTQAELDADTAAANEVTIRTQAATALTANATYLAIASPTNAQVVAQVRALTQQTNKLIRLTIRDLTSTA